MLKRIVVILAFIFATSQVNAFDKNKINLGQTFWGTWGLFNPATSCTEDYQFSQPGNFVYKAQQKELSGKFAIIRNNNAKNLDLLVLDIQNDNGKVGCGADANNYQGKKSNFFLKWISTTSAEICVDDIGKQCTGLYLNKR